MILSIRLSTMPTPTQLPKTHTDPCPGLIRLQEQLNSLGKDTAVNAREIRTLIELAAQIKLLMSLSIGGGAMSLINLILMILNGK